MTYTKKNMGGSTEFRLDEDRIVITKRRIWRKRIVHDIPRDTISATSALIEHPDRVVSWPIRGTLFAVSFGIVLYFLKSDLTDFFLWLCVVVLVSAFVFVPSITFKKKHFVACSSSGQTMFSIPASRGPKGEAEFRAFVAACKQWLNENAAETGPLR